MWVRTPTLEIILIKRFFFSKEVSNVRWSSLADIDNLFGNLGKTTYKRKFSKLSLLFFCFFTWTLKDIGSIFQHIQLLHFGILTPVNSQKVIKRRFSSSLICSTKISFDQVWSLSGIKVRKRPFVSLKVNWKLYSNLHERLWIFFV